MKRWLILTLISMVAFNGMAQKQKTDSILNNRVFKFRATQAYPSRGNMVILTDEYDLVIRKDSIISFLPFFGRAFQAPLPGEDGGIKFTSTKFTWEAKKKKKGWSIVIIPKDLKYATKLFLDVSENGQGRLQVSSSDREWISFNGRIEAIK